MCADFQYYLNRTGPRGPKGYKGDKGDDGKTPVPRTGTNTPIETTVIFDTGDGNPYETPNLKYPIEDRGGNMVMLDRTNNTQYYGTPDQATDNSYGVVKLATPESVLDDPLDTDVVTYKLFDDTVENLNNVLTNKANIEDIPTVGNGTITIKQGNSIKGTFTTNQSNNSIIELDASGGGGGTTYTEGDAIDLTNDTISVKYDNDTLKLNGSGKLYADIPAVNDAIITITQGGVTKGTFTTNQSVDATIALDAGGGGTVDAYTKAETDALLANKITTTAPTSPLEWLPDTSQNIIMSGFPTGQTTVSSRAGRVSRSGSYATVLGLWNDDSFTNICYSPSIVNTSSAPYIEVDISSLNIGGTIFSYNDYTYENTRSYGYVLGYEDNNSFVPVLTISSSQQNAGISLCYIKESGGEGSTTVGYKHILTYSEGFNNSYFMFSSNNDFTELTLAGGKYTEDTYKDSEKADISVSQYFTDADSSTRISRINKVRIYSTTVSSGSSYENSTLDLSKVKFINPTTITTTDGNEATRKATFDSSDNILDAHLEQLNLKYDSNTLGVNSNNELYGKIGDGTITLTQGTTTLGTFSVNQSSNSSINIPASGGGGGTSYAAGDGIDISGSDVISAKVDGTTIGIDSSTKEIKLLSSIPTDTSDLTNGAGYITGITSGDVTTALGYTPYSSSNPNGYTSNVGTVTSVNNTQPDSDGNVTLSIPDTTNMVTTNTTQTISGSKTFSTETHHQGVITFDSALGTPIIRGTSGSSYRNMIARSNTYSTVTTGNTSDNLILKGALTRPKYSHDSSDGNYLALYSDIPGDMTGAGASTAGAKGLVPAPAAGDNTKFLAGDGTWKDISGANTDLSNLSSTGNIKIANLGMPASSSVSVTIPTDNGNLTAPYNGYYRIEFHSNSNRLFYFHIRDNIVTDYLGSGSFSDLWIWHPVSKGTVTTFNYANLTVDSAVFVKAIGEVNS